MIENKEIKSGFLHEKRLEKQKLTITDNVIQQYQTDWWIVL